MGGRVSSQFLASLSGSQVIVLGAGVTGAPTVDFLKSRGVSVQVIDEKNHDGGVLNSLSSLKLSDFSFAVVSPGWQLSLIHI